MKRSYLILCFFLLAVRASAQDSQPAPVSDPAPAPARVSATAGTSASSRAPVSPKQSLAALQARYERHTLSDTAYLNAVDSILDAPDSLVHMLYNDDSLEQRLRTYQSIAFADTLYGKYRVRYYRYLLSAADNRNRSGSSIYYAEKDNEESVRMGYFEKDELPHNELFAIAVYLDNRDYARVFARYDALRPLLLAMPGNISAGRKAASPDGVSMIFAVLDVMCYAAAKTGDTAKLNEAIGLCDRMLDEVGKQEKKYREYRIYYAFIYHTIGFLRENYLGHTRRARDLLEASLQEVRDKGFGKANDPEGYTVDRYMDAFKFYFDQGPKDSAAHYLDLIRHLAPGDPEFDNDRLSFVLDGDSKLLAREGRYLEACQDLRRVYAMKDSAFYAAKSDRDNNLYALAAAENTGYELLRTEAMKSRTERYNSVLLLLLVLLTVSGVVLFVIFRSIQKRHLLNLRLGIVRNFHEEIGPMLLDASKLVNKEAEANPSGRLEDLKGQMVHVMEAVRGIAHDLSTKELSTVASFSKEVISLLEKVKAATRIDFAFRSNHGNRVLSQVQYIHLRTMVGELISNSVKHAGCSLITFQVKEMERDLRIEYADNGKGMAMAFEGKGIGIQNIRERANLLNGGFQLQNTYPEGYLITISVPLV